jgi:hypothetical protein
LLLITVSATLLAGFAATALAADTNSTTTDTTTITGVVLIDNSTEPTFGGFGMMIGHQGFGGPGGPGGGHGREFGGFMGNIEVSSAYNQTVTNILGNDTDVQKLVTQGYTVTTIRPVVQSTLSADGTVTTKAATAIVTMHNGTSGHANVGVDITNAKVTQIVILTKTVIDKIAS